MPLKIKYTRIYMFFNVYVNKYFVCISYIKIIDYFTSLTSLYFFPWKKNAS